MHLSPFGIPNIISIKLKLFFRKYGQGRPLIILHGLFGQSDNWNTLAKQFAENDLEVYTVDLRNHGLSPWSTEWNFKVMSEDIIELIEDQKLRDPILLGHSLGGKVAMQLALDHPDLVTKLLVVDISPKEYRGKNDTTLKGLLSADLSVLRTRKEVEVKLAEHIKSKATLQFIAKNLYWKNKDELAFRFNLDVIAKNFAKAGDPISSGEKKFDRAAVFIRGENSDYLSGSDLPEIKKAFPAAALITINGAGHWVHADKPKEFFEEVIKILAD